MDRKMHRLLAERWADQRAGDDHSLPYWQERCEYCVRESAHLIHEGPEDEEPEEAVRRFAAWAVEEAMRRA